MKFFVSWEADKDSGENLRKITNEVYECIVKKLDRLPLNLLDFSINYVPIVMSADNRVRYPPRSRLNRKRNEYNCAPQLDYDVFVSGTWNEMLTCYLNGIRVYSNKLKVIGFDAEMIQEFLIILNETEDELKK